MKKLNALPLALLILFSVLTTLPIAFSVHDPSVEPKIDITYAIPLTDDSLTNPHYKLLRYHSYSTINYYVNPTNSYRFSQSAVINTITGSVNTWDVETAFQVLFCKGTTSRIAGTYDGYSVISWGTYSAGIIAVTMSWARGKRVLEVDCLMNTYYGWSLAGEAGKMDVQNITTHELCHFCCVADLYNDADYWLTMYGYASFGETYKRTLGTGDILDLEAFYGP